MSTSLVILAAGIGSRFGGLKQIEPVGPSGEFIIEYSIYDAVRAGVSRIVFVIQRSIEQDFKHAIGTRAARIAERAGPPGSSVEIDYVFQELSDLPDGAVVPADRKKPWGTGHAVLAAAPVVNGPFIVINADDFYGAATYEAIVHFFEETASEATLHAMVAYILSNTLSPHGHVCRGVCDVDGRGLLQGVEELTNIREGPDGLRNDDRALTGEELVSMNCWGFKPAFMDDLAEAFRDFLRHSGADAEAEFFIPTVANALIVSGTASVRVLRTTAKWVGVTYREEREDVVRHIQQLVDDGEYPRCLWA